MKKINPKHEKKKKSRKRTRGPVYIKYNPSLSKKLKRKLGALKKFRELGIITGKRYLIMIECEDNMYEVYVSHEDMLYDFNIDNISRIIIGNPEIYKEWEKGLKTKSSRKDREYMPTTVMNEKNPHLSDPDYLERKRMKFIKEEINPHMEKYF